MYDQSKKKLSRREFITRSTTLAAGLAGAFATSCATAPSGETKAPSGADMKFGLVTYLWGKDWKLPALIRNCQRAGVYGVELRVDHAHGVSPALSSRERAEVRMRFQYSPVELVGFGTNYAFHYTDKEELQANLQGAKEYVRLSSELGGGGVKVKPNALPDDVPEEQTIEQIGRSLNDLGEYAGSYGQEIRVEVHGRETSRLPIMKRIFDLVDQPSVGVCWNCNDNDLEGEGLEHNFNLVRGDFSQIVHIRELGEGDYPYQELFNLFAAMNYNGWILLEARTNPGDRINALKDQRELFEEMQSKAQASTT
ncbi:MAG: sugar phosphate isomerase/epimerase family protein [Bacteroidales bacterium]